MGNTKKKFEKRADEEQLHGLERAAACGALLTQPEIDALKAKAKRSLMQNDRWWTEKLYTQDENVKLKEEIAALKAKAEKLQKVAKEAAEVLEWYHEYRIAAELRAALEGK